MTRYTFTLDASACSGCKACQVACKDKHDLPAGVLWRRVYEVTGGGWERRDGAWLNDVYAYNVSMACNHCDRPICLKACPTAAIHRRVDGIVLIDADRCMGCRNCEWACPYGALQFDADAGQMTKCTFCVDELDAGRDPACVAACPLRVLGIETANPRGDEDPSGSAVSSSLPIFPMPDPELTEPAFRVVPHPRAGADPRVANAEEVAPGRSPGLREPSLVAFTLLAQTAVGMLWALLATMGGRPTGPGSSAVQFDLPVLAAVAVLAVGAMVVSFLHLGRPRNAVRALANVRSSWLSREVLFMALFAAASMALVALEVVTLPRIDTGPVEAILAGGAAAAGVGLLYSMVRVYRLRTVPAWDTTRTTAGFFGTALILGTLGWIWVGQVVAFAADGNGTGTADNGAGVVAAGVALLVAVVAAAWARTRFYASHERVGV